MAIVKFTKKSKWSEISLRFCRFHGLPFGSEIKVIYTNNPKFSKGRVQRDNTSYLRATFRKDNLPQALESETVRRLIDHHLLPYIDMDFKTIGAEIAAFYPDGAKIENMRSTVGKWRKESPKLTQDELDAEDARLQEIDEIADEARMAINNLAEFRWDPEETVPRGMIRALIRSYDPETVRLAIHAELGGK
jgi:hypothetical protein